MSYLLVREGPFLVRLRRRVNIEGDIAGLHLPRSFADVQLGRTMNNWPLPKVCLRAWLGHQLSEAIYSVGGNGS